MTQVCKTWDPSLGSAFLFVCYNEVWPDMQIVGKFETYHHEVCHEAKVIKLFKGSDGRAC